MKTQTNIHPTANIWGDTVIGEDTKIGAFCDIGGAVIGKNCKIQAGVTIPPGWIIEDDVFIGPQAAFANDIRPKAQGHWHTEKGIVRKGASIGINATIMPVDIGEGATIGAGAVVIHNVPGGETWVGNPAKKI